MRKVDILLFLSVTVVVISIAAISIPRLWPQAVAENCPWSYQVVVAAARSRNPGNLLERRVAAIGLAALPVLMRGVSSSDYQIALESLRGMQGLPSLPEEASDVLVSSLRSNNSDIRREALRLCQNFIVPYVAESLLARNYISADIPERADIEAVLARAGADVSTILELRLNADKYRAAAEKAVVEVDRANIAGHAPDASSR